MEEAENYRPYPREHCMKLVVIHHHLLPGGVTGVIVDGCRAIIRFLPEVESITLVCGRRENVEAVRALILEGMDERLTDGSFRIDVLPEIDYDDHGGSGSSSEVRDLLTGRYSRDDSIFWIHNFHLGKNPAYTKALIDMAQNQPSQRFIFQIHDFPECARYENLARLNREISGTLYPIGSNVLYAVINARDREALINSGVPDWAVRVQENPVARSPEPVDGSNTTATRRKLFDLFGSRFPAAEPDSPILLYPVRTIRRKNVLEAGFIAAASPLSVNLVVTLPGVSAAERGYSAMVEQVFAEELVPGLWGIGREIEAHGMSFLDLVRVSDMVVSSSVLEGFGYQFINSLVWGKPLVARYLDILDSIRSLFDDHPKEWYDAVSVPLGSPSIKSLRAYLAMRYQERIREVASYLSPDLADAVAAEIEQMLAADTVDFSFLPVQVQYTVLKDLRTPAYRAEVIALNSTLFSSIERLLHARPGTLSDRVENRLGLQAFAGSMRALIGSFPSDTKRAMPQIPNIRQNIVREFSRKEYLRLLFEPVADGSGEKS